VVVTYSQVCFTVRARNLREAAAKTEPLLGEWHPHREPFVCDVEIDGVPVGSTDDPAGHLTLPVDPFAWCPKHGVCVPVAWETKHRYPDNRLAPSTEVCPAWECNERVEWRRVG